MEPHRLILSRSLLALLIVLLAFNAGGAAAQSTGPLYPPENDPLDPAARLSAIPAALPQPAASGGGWVAPAAPGLTPQSINPYDDRENTTPTGWYVFEGLTPADVTSKINTGLRIVDLTVQQTIPDVRFTAVFVSESGTYNKAWWWYYGVSVSTLGGLLSANNARLTVLKPYVVNGVQVYAAVMIANTGADATGWWWYIDQTPASISNLLSANQARLIQNSAYITPGGLTRYAVVMVDNTGTNNRGWWWYFNVTAAQVSGFISANNARLVDTDLDPVTGNLNVIMVSCSGGCPYWWWYYNIPESQLLDLVGQDGARIIDAVPHPGCGSNCWNIVLINNSNAITTRVGQLLRSNDPSGMKGLYLKQVNGPVLAALLDDRTFEPASTIKAAVHLYTMQKLQSGPQTLNTQITKYDPPVSGSCPATDPANGTETIATADREMMWHSDNTRTRELVDHWGVANINAMLHSAGIDLNNTSINHVIGCGGPIPNQTTLDDLSHLYENVATANSNFVNTTYRDLFFANTAGKAQFQVEGYDWTGLWSTDIPAIIASEAPAGMSQARKDWFRASMNLAYKAGNYKLCGTTCADYVDDISIAGYAKIPFCDGGGAREFTFGVYISNSTSDTNSGNAFTATKAELLREQIHAGLASCAFQVSLPLITR